MGNTRQRKDHLEPSTKPSIETHPETDRPGSFDPTKSNLVTKYFRKQGRKDSKVLQACLAAVKAASIQRTTGEMNSAGQTIDTVCQPRIRKISQPQNVDTQQINAPTVLSNQQISQSSVGVRKHFVQFDEVNRHTSPVKSALSSNAKDHSRGMVSEGNPFENGKTQYNVDSGLDERQLPNDSNLAYRIKKGRKALSNAPIGGLHITKYKLSDNDPRDKAKRKLLSIRKHRSLDLNSPFVLAQELHEKGQISARAQAASLHHEYHLPLMPEVGA